MLRLLLLAALAAAAAAACPPFSLEDAAAGCVLCDCDGACSDARASHAAPGDGVCNSAAPNLACSAFEWDGGDCEPPDSEPDLVARQNVFLAGPGMQAGL